MSSDLDLPLLPSAEQIRRREFATVRRGYDPDQVRDYLMHVSSQVETLEKELREIKMHVDTKASRQATAEEASATAAGTAALGPSEHPAFVAAPEAVPDDNYGRLAERFAEMIKTADEQANKVLGEAHAESARILEQARTEADRTRLDAQARAEEARQQGDEELQHAKEEADRILGSLAERREALASQMHEMQSKLLAVAKDLDLSLERSDTGANTTAGPVSGADTAGADADALVDPRYEDLWVSDEDSAVDIPDLQPLDLDFDEDAQGKDL